MYEAMYRHDNYKSTTKSNDLSKVKVEARALTTIETFTIEGDCELSPLLKKVLMNGLFALLSETNTIMDKILL